MINQLSNPCVRCGKPRINSKTWIEEVGTFNGKSIITHTETVCPDPSCQKIVAEGIAKQKIKSDLLKSDRAERMRISQANRKRN